MFWREFDFGWTETAVKVSLPIAVIPALQHSRNFARFEGEANVVLGWLKERITGPEGETRLAVHDGRSAHLEAGDRAE